MPHGALARCAATRGNAPPFGSGRRTPRQPGWLSGYPAIGPLVCPGERYGDLERVLASEVLHRHHDSYPPAGWEDTLGLVYARALAITGTGDRPIVLTGNLWGFMYYSDQSGVQDYGPLGTHLIEAGPAAVRHLVPLLDDPASLFYEGSREATLGNSLRYRVKDAAAYYLGKLTGIPVAFHEEPQERDAEIDRLKAAVAQRA